MIVVFGGAIMKSNSDHFYRDCSQVAISDLVVIPRMNQKLFPAKLHRALAIQHNYHIIHWKQHGRSWVVANRSLFISIILPKYFNLHSYESFSRSLNGWGFKVWFAANSCV